MKLTEAIDLAMKGKFVKLEDKKILPPPNFKFWSKNRRETFFNTFKKYIESNEAMEYVSDKWEEISKEQYNAELADFKHRMCISGKNY
jgi:hypothetical protein